MQVWCVLMCVLYITSATTTSSTTTCGNSNNNNNNNNNLQQQWSTPIHIVDDALPRSSLAKLVHIAKFLETKYHTITRSNRGEKAWQSHNLLRTKREAEDLQVKVLVQKITDVATTFLLDGNQEDDERQIDVASVWFNINYEGEGHNIAHTHSDSVISGVLYVQTDDIAHGGELVLLDPRTQVYALSAYTNWFGMARNKIIDPVVNRMVLFPSFVPHRVETYESNRGSNSTHTSSAKNCRISIAFNIRVLEKDLMLKDE